MKRIISFIFPFEHTFEQAVKAEAYSDLRKVPPHTTDIKQLAYQKAEQFYQSGHIWFIFKASWIGTQQQVTETYANALIDAYHTAQP